MNQLTPLIIAHELGCSPKFAVLCARREFSGYYAIDSLVAELQRMYAMCEISKSLSDISFTGCQVSTYDALTHDTHSHNTLAQYLGQCIEYIMNDPTDVEVISNEALIGVILNIAHGRRKFRCGYVKVTWAEIQRRIATSDAPDSVHELLQNLPF
jgi:hypothetical protein